MIDVILVVLSVWFIASCILDRPPVIWTRRISRRWEQACLSSGLGMYSAAWTTLPRGYSQTTNSPSSWLDPRAAERGQSLKYMSLYKAFILFFASWDVQRGLDYFAPWLQPDNKLPFILVGPEGFGKGSVYKNSNQRDDIHVYPSS